MWLLKMWTVTGVECEKRDWSRVLSPTLAKSNSNNGVTVALGDTGMTVEAARQCAKDQKEWRALVHM